SGLPAATLAMCSFSVAMTLDPLALERQRLVDRRAVDCHGVFALQPGDELVEQVIRHAGCEGIPRILRYGIGAGARGLEHFRHLEDDLRIVGRRGYKPAAALGDAEDRCDAGAAEIAIVGFALQAALDLLLQPEFGRQSI